MIGFGLTLLATLINPSLGLHLLVSFPLFLLLTYIIKNKELFSPVSLAGVIWLFFAAWLSNPYKITVHNIYIDQKNVLFVAIVALIGILSYLIGIAIFQLGKNKVRTNYEYITSNKEGLSNRILKTSIIATLIGLMFAIPVYLKLGIPLLQLEAMNPARRAFISALSPYVYYQWYFFEISSIIAFYGYITSRKRKIKNIFIILLLINISALLVVASRVTVGMVIFYSIMLLHFYAKEKSIGLQVLVSIGAALLIVSGFWIFRTIAFQSYAIIYGANLEFTSLRSIIESLLKGFFIFMISPVEAFSYLATHNIYMYGEITFMSFIQMLPGRQHEIGLYKVSEILGKSSLIVGGTTVTLIGGLYIDFSWPGVIVGMGLLGFVLAYLYRRIVISGYSLQAVGLYMIILVYYFAMCYGGQFLDVSLFWKIFIWTVFSTFIHWGRSTYTVWGKISTVFVIIGIIMGILNIWKL